MTNEMKPLTTYLNHWGDTKSLNNLKEKTPLVEQAEIQNLLKELTMAYDRGPTEGKFDYWAKLIMEKGYSSSQVKSIIKTIPERCERFPSLSEILAFLKPFKTTFKSESIEVNKDALEAAKIKDEWLKIMDQETLDKMTLSYCKNVLGLTLRELQLNGLTGRAYEMLVLLDWKRSGFGNAEAILRQGKASQERTLKALP
jgi:hypothetical protein